MPVKIIDILILRDAMPSSIAITADLLASANRILAVRGRPAAFSVRATGSGARAARPLLASLPSPGDIPADLIIVPGLGFHTEASVHAGLVRKDASAAQRHLAEALHLGAEIAASCSAVFLLAATGMLDGRRATTTWWLAPLFRRLYPTVTLETDALVTRDGPITTAGAAMAQLDLMLALISRHASPKLAADCARYLVLDQRTSQAPYASMDLLAASDAQVARATKWARARLDQDFTVDELADAAGLAPRTFARRVERATGVSPVRLIQRLRIDRAVKLLETTRLPIEEIARQVGYADASTLRRLLRRETGGNPHALRSAARTKSA